MLISAAFLFCLSACKKDEEKVSVLTEVSFNGKTYTPAVDGYINYVYSKQNNGDSILSLIVSSFLFTTGDTSFNIFFMQADGKKKIRIGHYNDSGYSYVNTPGNNSPLTVYAERNSKGIIHTYDQLTRRMTLSYEAVYANYNKDTFRLNARFYNIPMKEGVFLRSDRE